MSTFKIYADAGLTVPITGAGSVDFSQIASGAAVDRVVYFGSAEAGKKLQAASDPGTDPVELSIFDSNALAGLEPTAMKLALSSGGLDAATAGAALALGTTILSGTANAVPVFIRSDAATATPAVFDDLVLRVAGVLETVA